jgi:hypothetical protein
LVQARKLKLDRLQNFPDLLMDGVDLLWTIVFRHFRMKLVAPIISVSILGCISGCASPVALNTMGSVGGNDPVAFGKVGKGKIESFWIAKYEDVIEATLRAGEELSLELKEKKVEENKTFFRYHDAKKDKIDLIVERRSDKVTSVKFNVGWYGSVALSRLMAKQIISVLNQTGSFPEHWKYKISE